MQSGSRRRSTGLLVSTLLLLLMGASVPGLLGMAPGVAALAAGVTALTTGSKDLNTLPGFESCSIGSGAAQLLAQCGSVTVPLDPNDPQGRQLDLAIARIPARRLSSRQDAFTLLAGGPGQSAIESFPMLAFAFRHIMKDHDVVLVDQRGTGESARLSCPQSDDTLGTEMDVNLEAVARNARECLDSLDYDPRLFTTSVAVQDLEFVRQALGVGQWNLYGISYGTRVAQHYARRFPQAVRSMVLDAVVPAEESLGPDIAALAQRSLDMIFERCLHQSGCKQAFGDLREPTLQLLDELEERARTVRYEDIVTGRPETMEFTREHLAITLRLLTYNSQTTAILPSMLHEAIVNDNFAPLARQASLQADSLGDSLATGMHHAVVCTEDIPFFDLSTHSGDRRKTSYMGDKVVDSLKASCEQWPAGLMDDDFKDPLMSDIPALVLSGEADPITPPEYGSRVAETLSDALHIINPDQGHMQAASGCMPVILAQFVERANAQSLDTECLKRLSVLPFFVDANGPLP